MRKRWKYLVGGLTILVLALYVGMEIRKRQGSWYTLNKEERQAVIDWHNEAISRNKALDFYGKFIDQHGQPVEGVKVIFKVQSMNRDLIKELKAGRIITEDEGPPGMGGAFFMFGKDIRLVRYSDANGLFSVEEQDGTSIDVIDEESFHKEEGYIYVDRVDPDNDPPDSDQPVIFYMWKRSSDPPSRLIERLESYKFKADGNWHGYDPITGEKIADDDPRADLVLSARIEQQGDDPDVYDWQLTLKMSKGGIQRLASFPYHFLAPEDGYRKTIIWKGKSEDRRKYWGSFYLRSYEGRVYASVYIEAEFKRKQPEWELRPTEDGHEYFKKDPEDGGHPYVEIYYSWLINPFGNRSLEYDPHLRKKLNNQHDAGKISDEEYNRLWDEDPVRRFDEKELNEIVELLQQGKTPKEEDYE